MSVQQEHATSETATLTTTESGCVYQSLFDKINLTPVSSIQEIDLWQNSETLADASPDERVTAAIHVLLSCLAKSGEDVVKLDKSLLDFHIDDLDQKISKQLDAVMHHPEFQKVESLWRGTWFVVQRTDFRKNVRIELLDISKEHLRQDFDDSPEIIQSGLYRHTYIQEYDTPGTLAWQAATGRENRGLSDSLAKSAQELFNGKEKTPQQSREGDVPVGPLDKTFAPLLRLLGDKSGSGGGDTQLSLQTYLTRVTRVRLKLQQVTNAPDPQEMTQQLAQTVLQGKTVDLTDTRDYGRLIAASLGEEWNGFGQALFVRPVEQSWRQVLTPAADSLNRQWQRAIVSHWNQDFAGRYPFKASQNDASLPLLAQYLRDDGRINQFIAANLSGVLKREGRYWVADAMNTQGLTVNPDFIRALNRLRDVADTAFASGDAGIHFELRAKPARDVMKTHLVIDGQELEYFNQKERWQRFNWPDEQWQPGASLSWTSTQAMERILAAYRGSWSLIRLLDLAQVTPVDSSTFKVVWKAQDGLPLNYLLRVEQGKGPMALLELKNFRLPGQVFLTGKSMKDAEEYGEDADE